jgi:hypothetical protein
VGRRPCVSGPGHGEHWQVWQGRRTASAEDGDKHTPTHLPPSLVILFKSPRKSYVRRKDTAPMERRNISFNLGVFNLIRGSYRTKLQFSISLAYRGDKAS